MAGGGQPEREGISLSNALKLSGFAQTGGHAKELIQSGQVKVNGEVETRRKRTVVPGDEIEVQNEIFVIDVSE